MNKALVFSSLALNAVLLGACAWLAFRDSSHAAFPASGAIAATVSGVSANEPREAYRKIKAAGVPDGMADQLLAVAVMEATAHDVPVADAYWKSSVVRGVARSQAELKAQEAGRKMLLETAGAGAPENPAFRSFFRPLDPQMAFLSSEKQIAVQNLRLESQRQIEAGKGPLAEAQLTESIRGLLTPEEFFEYQLRNSRTAQFLRASGFDFEEREYREVFRIVTESATNQMPVAAGRMGLGGPPVLSDAVLKQVQAVLGADRFRQYQRTQDPAYRLVASIAGARGLPKNAVDEAYGVLAQGAGKSAASATALSNPSPGSSRVTGDVSVAQNAELVRILGNEAAGAVVRALSFRGSALNIPPVTRMAPGAATR